MRSSELVICLLVAGQLSATGACSGEGLLAQDEQHSNVGSGKRGKAASYEDLEAQAEKHYRERRFAEARALYQKALRIREKKLGAMHPSLAAGLRKIGELDAILEVPPQEIEPLYKRALAIDKKANADTRQDQNALGLLYERQGKLTEALELYSRQFKDDDLVYVQHGGPNWFLSQDLGNMARVLSKQHNFLRAQSTYKRAIEIELEHQNNGGEVLDQFWHKLALLYIRDRNFTEAEKLCKKALPVFMETRPHDMVTGARLTDLATVYAEQGKYDQAEPLLKQAQQIAEISRLDSCIAFRLSDLAWLYACQRQFDKAEPMYREALERADRTFQPWGEMLHPGAVTLLERYASLLRETNRPAEAQPLELRAKKIQASLEIRPEEYWYH